MKKVIIILAVVFISCQPIDNTRNKLVVVRVKQKDKIFDNVKFFYVGGLERQALDIIDSAGKWRIGDTLI